MRTSAVVTLPAEMISGMVTKGWAPGISLNEAIVRRSRSTTASYVLPSRRRTASAARGIGSPAFQASTAAFGGSWSVRDANMV